jgi:hypothetical protein
MGYASIGYASGSHVMVGHQQEVTRRLKPRLVAFGWPSAQADGKSRASACADARPQALRRHFSRPLKASPNCLISKNLVFA